MNETCEVYTEPSVDGQCGDLAVGKYEIIVEADDGEYRGEAWLCEEHASDRDGPIRVEG